MKQSKFLGTEPIPNLICKLVPPMMLVFLVQALYNIIDSLFIARYDETGLTALSIIFPMQLIILAVASGTGSGINVIAARLLGEEKQSEAEKTAFHGLILGIVNWLVFTFICLILLSPYLAISASEQSVIKNGMDYGVIILIFSFGLYIESNCTKILQAVGNMKIPMIAQTSGAVCNIIFDYLLIFGKFGMPEMGISGAAAATVAGQILAMIISLAGVLKNPRLKIKPCKIQLKLFLKIYNAAMPNIIMQSLYTVYIFGLNLILGTFSAAAVTVLGIYYKLQSFFFIPLFGMEQAILPIISYNHGLGDSKRIRDTLKYSCFISVFFMGLAAAAFMFIPSILLEIFSENPSIISIGITAFPIIGLSFIPAAVTLLLPVFFQGLGKNFESIFVTVLRQIVLFVPLAWILSKFGLKYVWLTFPLTESITLAGGIFLLLKNKNELLTE